MTDTVIEYSMSSRSWGYEKAGGGMVIISNGSNAGYRLKKSV
jgi:hypothetical protein